MPINSTSVRVCMQDRFKERLVKEAKKAGVGLSTYIKYALLEKWNRDQQAGISQKILNENKREDFWRNWKKEQNKMTDQEVLDKMHNITLDNDSN